MNKHDRDKIFDALRAAGFVVVAEETLEPDGAKPIAHHNGGQLPPLAPNCRTAPRKRVRKQ